MDKAALRRAALDRRKAAHDPARGAVACERLIALLRPNLGRPVAGYMPIRSEIDPRPAMTALAAHGPVAVPVIAGAGRPLRFRCWSPGCAMVPGPFGASVPEHGDEIVPEVLIVPLVGFDRCGARLGYGGGFYDRTLEGLRARGPVLAVGLAYAAQEIARVPVEPTDQPLDAIVTEAGIIHPENGD
ncbi:5-formyltetrahydrofolate cyclo-ligase [Rhodovulum adriaticum]|uniref:5-formyltetrahydrofolate cyclo-ligase n=1 Tax=Rhodovulum adriaticum TaxID=35804 RepID=UPI00104B7F6B|nr:5-formyltetrahydrofolate cyclo-ligase [Rhodovulum adriaticum]MBK1634666.1 5-formyltetrahydrofolate cyclo-ligase [Rhodovulum adriaticum]